MSLLESINLKTSLLPYPVLIGPRNFHELPGLYLPPEKSTLQHQLSDLLAFTEANKMKINTKKTKIMPFNLTKKFDFIPQLSFPDQQPLEVINETKLLGITLACDLRWWPHIKDITKRATSKLWVLIRFKSLGGTEEQLRQIYLTRVHSILEFGAPFFHSGLTKEQTRKVEKVQKKALVII